MNLVTKSVFLCTALATIFGASVASARPLQVYLSAPGSQSTIFTGTQTETFEGFAAGQYNTNLTSTALNGTYNLGGASQLRIMPNDQYGSNTGQYATFGVQTGTTGPVTLSLATPQEYFGFSWNAGDRNNKLTFLRNGVEVGSYSTQITVDTLSGPTVTALGGAVYQSSAYFGQPTTGLNPTEPYAFINFLSAGAAFDTIVFENNATDTGFESDNHTIRLTAPGPDDTFVDVTNDPAVPEPAPVALAIILGGGICGQILRVRAKNKKNAA